MKSTVENLSPTRVRLAVEVPFEELKPSLDAAYKQIGAQVRVPGFRPGKVPARVIDQRVGRGAVLEQAVNEALPRALWRGCSRARAAPARPAGHRRRPMLGRTPPSRCSFTAEVDVRPEIDAARLRRAGGHRRRRGRQRRPRWTSSSRRCASASARSRASTGRSQEGDYVSIDLVATVDGEEVEGGSAQAACPTRSAPATSSTGWTTRSPGERRRDPRRSPTDAAAGRARGRARPRSRVTVNSVKEKELPEVDDEFAQLASEFDTARRAARRPAHPARPGQGASSRARRRATGCSRHLLDQGRVPGAGVGDHGRDRVPRARHRPLPGPRRRACSTGTCRSQGKTREEFEAELRESAEKSVRAQFLLDAIADKAEVQVGDAELTELPGAAGGAL